MIDPFDYFQQPTLLRLNEWLEHFPRFIPEKFSEYLLEKTEDIVLINYQFQRIYEATIEIENKSKDNFVFNLNSLKLEVLSRLLELNLASLFKIYRKLNGIYFYFRLLKQENLYGLIEYLAQLYKESANNNVLYMFKLSHSIPYLDEFGIHKFLNDPNMEEFKRKFSSVFSRDELKFLVQKNEHIYEIIYSIQGKDYELEYETNITTADYSEIEQVLMWFLDEYKTEWEKFKNNEVYDTNILKEKNNKHYLCLEYILTFIKDMPVSKRTTIINEITKSVSHHIFLVSRKKILHKLKNL